MHLNIGLKNVLLVTQSVAESQGAGPCNIRGIYIRCPARPGPGSLLEGVKI